MATHVRKLPPLDGAYALEVLGRFESVGGGRVECGIVRFAAGTRSPAAGLHTNSRRELAFILSGRVLVETAEGSFEASAGDVLISSPSDPHATTGLDDATLLFVLVDPLRTLGTP